MSIKDDAAISVRGFVFEFVFEKYKGGGEELQAVASTDDQISRKGKRGASN